MKKIFGLINIVIVVLLAGCGLVERFQLAEQQYLETRVEELMEEMPEEETPEPAPTQEEKEAETEEAVETEEASNTEEPEVTPTEEDEEETPEPTEEPTPKPTPDSDDPAEYLGDPDWVDEMDAPGYWYTGTDEYLAVSYENNELKFVALSETPGWRIAGTDPLDDAYIEAEFENKTCTGTDRWGLIFNSQKQFDYNQGYFFSITCDGRYALRLWDGEEGESNWLQYYADSPEINEGSDKSNRLGVMMRGDRLLLYVNGVKVDEVSDSTFKSGGFGVFLNRDKTENLTVIVDNAKYWLDPEEVD